MTRLFVLAALCVSSPAWAQAPGEAGPPLGPTPTQVEIGIEEQQRGLLPAKVEEGCPWARQLRVEGRIAEALEESRRCLSLAPWDAGAQLELSRALGMSGQTSEAMTLAEGVLARYPDDLEVRAWWIRLVAWSGDIERAWTLAAQLLDGMEGAIARGDLETARLLADLSLWTGRHWEAAERYRAILGRWGQDPNARLGLARALEGDGRLDEARELYHVLCVRNQLEAACQWTEQRGAALGLQLRAQLGLTVRTLDQPDWWETAVGLDAKVSDGVVAGLEVRWLERDFGAGPLHDFFIGGANRFRSQGGWTLDLEIGGTVSSDFYPLFLALAEPGFRWDNGWWTSLRAWRLQFTTGGANVINPNVGWEGPGGWEASLRVYHGLDDLGVWNLSALGRVGTDLTPKVHVTFGVGAGNQTDYLQFTMVDPRGGFVVSTVSGAWRFWPDHQVRLDYSARIETYFTETLQLHQGVLTYLWSL